MKQHTQLYLIAGFTFFILLVIINLPPIAQYQNYHQFADTRAFLGIPNFLDVISNVPLLLAGLLGIFALSWKQASDNRCFFYERAERRPYVSFFLGVILVSFGSAYYHLAPDNARLVWDRLPLAIIFMSFFAAVITERISVKTGLRLLIPLIIIGIGSVIYWYGSELQGQGDLRPYIFIQFYPIVVIPFIMYYFPARYSRSKDLFIALALYIASKFFELLDSQIYNMGNVISGHTIKHLLSAAAVYWIVRMLLKRQPMTE